MALLLKGLMDRDLVAYLVTVPRGYNTCKLNQDGNMREIENSQDFQNSGVDISRILKRKE